MSVAEMVAQNTGFTTINSQSPTPAAESPSSDVFSSKSTIDPALFMLAKPNIPTLNSLETISETGTNPPPRNPSAAPVTTTSTPFPSLLTPFPSLSRAPVPYANTQTPTPSSAPSHAPPAPPAHIPKAVTDKIFAQEKRIAHLEQQCTDLKTQFEQLQEENDKLLEGQNELRQSANDLDNEQQQNEYRFTILEEQLERQRVLITNMMESSRNGGPVEDDEVPSKRKGSRNNALNMSPICMPDSSPKRSSNS